MTFWTAAVGQKCESVYSHQNNLDGNTLVITYRVTTCLTLAGDLPVWFVCAYNIQFPTQKTSSKPLHTLRVNVPSDGFIRCRNDSPNHCSQELQTQTSKSDPFCLRCGGGTLHILLDINHPIGWQEKQSEENWSTLMIDATLVQCALDRHWH